MKPTFKVSSPTPCDHLKINAKKNQMEEARYLEIERENRILLNKLNSILQYPKKQTSYDSLHYNTVEPAPAGTIQAHQ